MMAQGWFWVAAAAMVLSVLVLLAQALRRGIPATSDKADVQVYRDQLAEVQRDLARGVISQPEAERVSIEVSRRLLDADRNARGVTDAPRTGSNGPVLIVIAASLAAAFGLYNWLGAPHYPDLPLQERLAMADELYRTRPSQDQAEATTPKTPQPADVDQAFLDLMTQLRAAIAARPDDLQGLALLARNEAALGDYIAARVAQAHLIDLKAASATAEDYATLAEFLIAAAGGYVSPEAEAALIRTLELDPTQGIARYYSGLMFAQVGRPDRTFALWEPLLREGPPDAPWMAPIRSGIEDVAARAGVNFTLDSKGPDAAAMAAAQDMSPEDRQAMIAGMVGQLEERLGSEGGPLEEWSKLITSLGVLGEADRAKAAYARATAAFAGDDAALAALLEAATTAGIAP
jgi:cytochrome c-type biogenesis protein CcmH